MNRSPSTTRANVAITGIPPSLPIEPALRMRAEIKRTAEILSGTFGIRSILTDKCHRSMSLWASAAGKSSNARFTPSMFSLEAMSTEADIGGG